MYPQEYLDFLAHFHGDRDYFECHEILEEYWKEIEPRNKNSLWVGLILLSVSTYHHRRKNFNGAKKTLEKAISIIEKLPDSLQTIGIDGTLLTILNERLDTINNEEPYVSFELPLSDPALLKQGQEAAFQKGFIWGKGSDISNISIIDRHKVRDRASVVQAREQSLNKRRGNE